MAEHVSAIEELKRLPRDFHIFCRREGDRQTLSSEEDASARRKKFFDALPLLAYDGPECKPYHQWLYDALDSQLSTCEECIRQYYLGKINFKTQLLQEYDDDEVQQFLTIINRRDKARIRAALDSVKETLEALPADKRSPKVLSNPQLFALFEALHCEAVYTDDKFLREHFDKPFQYVQTQKDLKIKDILPAIIKFLFSTEHTRLNWAVKTLQRLDRDASDEEWDWAIKDTLMKEVNQLNNEAGLIRFWSALKTIIDKLSKEQVNLKLFDLGFNFSKLALDHLAKRSMALPQIAACLETVWTKAPDAFWQVLTSVSATTVAEQFFGSPNFDKCLEIQVSADNKAGSLNVLSWMEPFLTGLQAASRPPATRTLVQQLFSRIGKDQTPEDVKRLCFVWAVKSLVTSVLSFSENEEARATAARPILSDVLSMVATHLPTVLSSPITLSEQDKKSVVRDDVLCLVRNSLALECQILRMDYEALQAGTPKASNSSYTPELWRTVNRYLDNGDPELSAAMVKSTMPLCGVEKFPLKSMSQCKAEKESFNDIFEKIEDLLSQCVGHLGEFQATHLDPLFSVQDTNMALMALLFSGNNDIYQASVELIKVLAQQPGRQEALSHLLDAFLDQTLYSIAWVFRRIATMMPFSPIPQLLKTGKDIMELLCDNTGLLRSRDLKSRENDAVQALWSYSWLMLTTIFRRTERWSIEVSDKPLMTEVCRNTMQYAKELFGYYYLVLKVVESNPRKSKESAPKILLNTDISSSSGSPPKALDAMVKWLRLKDPYLAETLGNLIIDMLRRLKEYGAMVAEDSYALKFVEEVATSGMNGSKGTKTILSDNQKAGLIRALEQYTGKQIARPVAIRVKKQQRLDTWTDPNIKREPTVKREIITLDDDDDVPEGIKDEDFREVEQAVIERKKALLDDKKAARKVPQLSLKKPSIAVPKAPTGPSATQRAFLEARKKEEAAAKAKKAELAARLRGRSGNEHMSDAGSGLAGLGVQGKDHVAPRSDMFASSESESESDEEDELFGGSTKTAAAIPSNVYAGKPISMPTKKVKQVRTAKDMRARLTPDMTNLHKTLLSWDFFAETEVPPNSGRDDYTLITNTFKTVEDYQRTFEPLLLLEAWQSFRTEREEGKFKPFEVKIANSMIVDNFFEVNSSVSYAEGRDLPFQVGDVVLFSKGDRPHSEPSEVHCFARVKEILRKRGEVQIVYRVNSSNNPMRQHLNDKAIVHAVQVLSLIPLEREYAALMALPYYDLSEEVIRARPSPLLDYRDDEVRDIKELHNLNTAQAKAVKSAMDNDAFTLVQGPPGSGKTKTITAILSTLITNALGRNISRPGVNGKPAAPAGYKKVMVCAPSNAAVDELVMRFKDGIKLPGGATEKINVVRLGQGDRINAAVKDVTIGQLTDDRLNATLSNGNSTNGREDIHTLMQEHKKTCEESNEVRQRMDETRSKSKPVEPADENLLDALKRKKMALAAKIDEARDKQNSATRDADINRRRIQQEIIDSAHVLCATLSGSGHEVLQNLNVEFETVIIDEAAQSIELSCLIPLKYGCSKCVLVGDPKQLPPTVLSRHAAKYQYEQSLFARMESNHQKDVHLLDVQYRMHPEISAFPSKTFYDSRLRDGGDMARLRARPWHRSQILSPYRFFDVRGLQESAPTMRGFVNKAEINVAMAMYQRLLTDVPRYNFKNKIGIITPYRGQLAMLKTLFSQRYGDSVLTNVEFNTTDAFQGRECEIIIFSCVRATTQGIGFLSDVRRMNVGLTRAKCSLWVLGSSEALTKGEYWRALVNDSKERNMYTGGDVLNLLGRPLLTEDMMEDDVEMGGMDEHSPLHIDETMGASAPSNNASESTSREQTATPVSHSSTAESTSRSGHADVSKLATSKAQQQAPSGPSSGLSIPRPDSVSRQFSSSSVPTRGNATNTPNAATDTNKQNNRRAAATDHAKSYGISGPSGGHSGLNPLAACSICGSDQHFSRSCDNTKAKEDQLGRCIRCGGTGHLRASCAAPRCLVCGEIGHVEVKCTMAPERRLTESERREVRAQEEKHQRYMLNNRERLAKRQLGEHGAKIPEVKTTFSSSPAPSLLVDGKRKRDDYLESANATGPAKVTKMGNGDRKANFGAPGASAGASSGPAGSTGPQIRAPGVSLPPKAPAQAQAQAQNMVRRKKVDTSSLFAKKR